LPEMMTMPFTSEELDISLYTSLNSSIVPRDNVFTYTQ
jgi:hypothetical protein